MGECLFSSTTLEELKSGDIREGDSGIGDDVLPDWYDDTKFRRGQAFFRKHISAITLSMHCSLVSGFSIINLLEPLVFTNASDTGDKAFKRYFMTFYHIVMWMSGNLWDKTSKAYKSIKTVRGMHKSVAKRMAQAYKDKIYVSQYDMGLVQSGFFGGVLMYPRQFGVRCTDEELDDYVYVWRVIGYCLGIEDEYNICSGSLEETKRFVKDIERKILIPALENPPKDFDKMADAYIDGVNKPLTIKLNSKKSILSLIWEGFGKPSPYELSVGDMLRYYHLKLTTFAMYYVPGARSVFNYIFWKSFEQHLDSVIKDTIKQDYIKYNDVK